MVRLFLYRFLKQFHRGLVLAPLILHTRQKMQGIKMLGSLREYFVIQAFSLCQLPAMVMCDGLLEFRCDGSGRLWLLFLLLMEYSKRTILAHRGWYSRREYPEGLRHPHCMG